MDVTRIVNARVIRDTDWAILVEVEWQEVWVPKSISEIFSAKQGEGELVDDIDVASWLAKKEGL